MQNDTNRHFFLFHILSVARLEFIHYFVILFYFITIYLYIYLLQMFLYKLMCIIIIIELTFVIYKQQKDGGAEYLTYLFNVARIVLSEKRSF